MTETRARYGWESGFPVFQQTAPRVIRESLQQFVVDASKEQIRAWDDTIPALQREVGEVIIRDKFAREYTAILEYELPMEFRRPDVVLLVKGAIIVLELKGKLRPSQADIDQAAAYARDLRCYHRECENRTVYAVLVPTLARGYLGEEQSVYIAGPDVIDKLVGDLEKGIEGPVVSAVAFLAAEAYRPMPSLVKAARELFSSGSVRAIHRARAATEPALNEITRIIHEAVKTRSRHLVLLTGVPGSGKTLVGLQAVHAHYLDDLAVPRENGKPTVPAVFLSGNGPLVEVLQYELRRAGGNGKTFVRGVMEYVRRYSTRPGLVPPEHVLVFDEAQRAFDADQVKEKHSHIPMFSTGKSEPEHFIEFAERIPQWCVVIGLIGSGQEIHIGEEGGLVQWRYAIERSGQPGSWKVHYPESVGKVFKQSSVKCAVSDALNLNIEIRFHLASDLHSYVERLLEANPAPENAQIAIKLEKEGYHLRITRDFQTAQQYLRERYQDNPEARFGLIASSKDRDLINFGIENDFQSTKRVRYGPWYADSESDEGNYSCRHLTSAVTEFGAQGLELDASLLAWGTDLKLVNGKWSNAKARGYQRKSYVKNPYQLRLNAYRVLLTRGRDATVVFVPLLPEMDETYSYLLASGFIKLG